MAKFVEDKIAQRKVMLFSKSYIPACNQAKEILKRFNMNTKLYEVTDIECRQDVNQIENYFQIICLTDSREVPQLFIDRKYVGGQKEILLLNRTGKLEEMINKVKREEEKKEKARLAKNFEFEFNADTDNKEETKEEGK